MNVNYDWPVSLSVAEIDGQTRAEVRLVLPGGDHLSGHGQARRNPADREVARIGRRSPPPARSPIWPGGFCTRPPPLSRTAPMSGPTCTTSRPGGGEGGCLRFLQDFSFTPDDLTYPRQARGYREETLRALSGLRFTGDVRAVPQGRVVFAG